MADSGWSEKAWGALTSRYPQSASHYFLGKLRTQQLQPSLLHAQAKQHFTGMRAKFRLFPTAHQSLPRVGVPGIAYLRPFGQRGSKRLVLMRHLCAHLFAKMFEIDTRCPMFRVR